MLLNCHSRTTCTPSLPRTATARTPRLSHAHSYATRTQSMSKSMPNTDVTGKLAGAVGLTAAGALAAAQLPSLGGSEQSKQPVSTLPAPASSGTHLSLFERGALGAAGGIATTFFTHPFDVVRVQMQVSKFNGTLDAATKIARQGGVPALYAGLSAAWLRQLTYGSGRLGIYSYLLDMDKRARAGRGDTSPAPFGSKLLMGMTSGCIGAAIGNPAELALVRMGADNSIADPAKRRNYANSIDCCVRVAKEEGFLTLWRGAAPTILRAAALNGALLGITSEAKTQISSRTGWSPTSGATMFCSTLFASIFANIFAMPFDVVKSRIQQASNPSQYTSMLDCARKSVASEGILVLWAGFTPAFIKLAPYSIISLTLLEKFTSVYTGGRSGAL
uniref:Mitochondrial 2-oxoglutarate/malate carrier protein n=1 Tax=Chrysotila carterae TaxID=13221 RepID=A0A7S4EYS5_CHRCT